MCDAEVGHSHGLLEAFLEKSSVVDIMICAKQREAIDALLELNIDVDSRGFCSGDLTILQCLCQTSASEHAVEVALPRTAFLHSRTDAGDTLVHLALKRANTQIQCPSEPRDREAVVRLLIQAGLELNARSGIDGGDCSYAEHEN